MPSTLDAPSNTVSYTRRNYMLLLGEVQMALGRLKKLRDDAIDAWENDEKARESDFNRLLMKLFIEEFNYGLLYRAYRDSLQAGPKPSLVGRLLGRKQRPAQEDEYGSVEAFALATHYESFDSYKADYIESRLKDGVVGWPAMLEKMAWNYSQFTTNEWDAPLRNVLKAADALDVFYFNARFTIPRSTFDYYFNLISKAEAGEVGEVDGELTLFCGWSDW